MKLLSKRNLFFITLFIFAFSTICDAQQGHVSINQDPRIDELVKLRKELEDKSDRYRIQIFSGDRTRAEDKRLKFKSYFSQYSTKLVYETPNYKIWAGYFRTRLEADRALIKVKRKFPNAFIFKPLKE